MRIRDGDWELFSHDEKLGRTVWERQNPDGTTTYRTDYRADGIIEQNTAMRNALNSGWKGDWHKVASIPLNVFHDQLAEAGRQDDDRYIAKWLNDSDHSKFRTKEGNL